MRGLPATQNQALLGVVITAISGLALSLLNNWWASLRDEKNRKADQVNRQADHQAATKLKEEERLFTERKLAYASFITVVNRVIHIVPISENSEKLVSLLKELNTAHSIAVLLAPSTSKTSLDNIRERANTLLSYVYRIVREKDDKEEAKEQLKPARDILKENLAELLLTLKEDLGVADSKVSSDFQEKPLQGTR